ncbi:hypothetical protein BOTBODRAFT_33800 [Botryobasidium botryosum FD-172 SS1]|uniref:Uncharacterized protein n=1 Tax=Botryobasidium botryosum (strain FD-172 SS1) TaxID=930990 RepID=A0A067MBP9_BOTB1|nr:hypothetical protein BOTBODRAFT_33800 [Botryobasidium botryosum FD-172 SS1]
MVVLPIDVIFNIYRLKRHDNDLIDLSHVCRLWRDALHSYPDFWATITLDLEKSSPDVKAAYWVERAGQKPLNIYIHSRSHHLTLPAHTLDIILLQIGLVLRGCMDRWESFKIHASAPVIEHLLPLYTGHAPKLRAFEIDGLRPDTDASRLLVPLLPLFEPPSDSSRLSVSIKGYIPRFTMLSQSITRLFVVVNMDSETDLFSMDDLFGILQASPNLIEFEFHAGTTEHLAPSSFSGLITLPRLTLFHIGCTRHVEDVLPFLRLPLLESIGLLKVALGDAAMAAVWDIFESRSLLSSITIEEGDHSVFRNVLAPFHENPLTLNNVTNFFLRGGSTSVQPLVDLLTLPRVQSLMLDGAPLGSVYRLISLSPDLRDLTIQIPAYYDPAPVLVPIPTPTFIPAPIFFPSLTSLKTLNAPTVVEYVHAPQLKTLILNHSFDPSARTRGSDVFLRALVERSAPPLTVLQLHNLDVGDEVMRWWFERLPDLEDLFISFCAISDSVLSALASPPLPGQNTDHRLLPRLKRFGFQENDHVTPRGAIEFLASRASRWPMPGPKGEFDFVLTHLPRQEEAAAILSFGDFLSMRHRVLYHMNVGL